MRAAIDGAANVLAVILRVSRRRMHTNPTTVATSMRAPDCTPDVGARSGLLNRPAVGRDKALRSPPFRRTSLYADVALRAHAQLTARPLHLRCTLQSVLQRVVSLASLSFLAAWRSLLRRRHSEQLHPHRQSTTRYDYHSATVAPPL